MLDWIFLPCAGGLKSWVYRITLSAQKKYSNREFLLQKWMFTLKTERQPHPGAWRILPPSYRDQNSLKKSKNACLVFENLVEAEAKVHGVPVQDTHLHEAGATDAIVDVVGTVLGLHLLGISAVYTSPLPLGGGTVQSEHGLLPVPTPAVMELVKGMPTAPSPAQTELVTPTGAAIVASLAHGIGPMPLLTAEE